MDKIKNMSLKKAFFFLTLSSLIIASILTVILYMILELFQDSIENKYSMIPLSSGNIIMMQSDTSKYSEIDITIIHAIDLTQVIFPFMIFIASLLLADIIFYKIKLKKPIEILNKGAKSISNSDLNFHLDYNSYDELGTLCNAFEKMRFQLNKNNLEMWSMIDDRKQLNAAFSHDLRNPLTVLKGYTNYLIKYIPTGKLNDKKILSTTQLMSEHIERIEHYVESMSNAQSLNDLVSSKSISNINYFIASLNKNISILSNHTKKVFTLNNHVDNTSLLIDKNIIYRVIENIISNAFRYAKNNVSLSIYTEYEFLTFVIEDDGIGFDDKSLKSALKPFYKDKASSTNENLGMGLYISKILCEKHGGSILIENNTQSGAKVTTKFSTKS